MEPIELIILLGLLLLGPGILGLVSVFYEKVWEIEWRGRRIRLVNRALREQLYVDDELVAQTRWNLMSAALSATIEDDDLGPVQLTASIQAAPDGVHVCGHLFADGEWVGGDPLVPGVLVQPARQEAEAEPEPDDPRWRAALQLLKGVRTSLPRLRETADHLREALRVALLELHQLQQSGEAHAALGQAPDERLDRALVVQEERVRASLRALQELHLLAITLRTDPTADVLAEVGESLDRLAAEVEVQGARLPREEPGQEQPAERARPRSERA